MGGSGQKRGWKGEYENKNKLFISLVPTAKPVPKAVRWVQESALPKPALFIATRYNDLRLNRHWFYSGSNSPPTSETTLNSKEVVLGKNRNMFFTRKTLKEEEGGKRARHEEFYRSTAGLSPDSFTLREYMAGVGNVTEFGTSLVAPAEA